jgi:hypothetical protein
MMSSAGSVGCWFTRVADGDAARGGARGIGGARSDWRDDREPFRAKHGEATAPSVWGATHHDGLTVVTCYDDQGRVKAQAASAY